MAGQEPQLSSQVGIPHLVSWSRNTTESKLGLRFICQTVGKPSCWRSFLTYLHFLPKMTMDKYGHKMQEWKGDVESISQGKESPQWDSSPLLVGKELQTDPIDGDPHLISWSDDTGAGRGSRLLTRKMESPFVGDFPGQISRLTEDFIYGKHSLAGRWNFAYYYRQWRVCQWPRERNMLDECMEDVVGRI